VIRKLIIILSLCVLLGASAHAGNAYNVQYGSSDYGIKFNSIVNCFSIFSYDADVSIKTFIGTSNQDSILIQEDTPYNLTLPCDSILVLRDTNTSVLIVASYHPQKCPFIGTSGNIEFSETLPVYNYERTVSTGNTVNAGDTLRLSVYTGDLAEYQLKFLASSVIGDSVKVNLASSNTGGWTTGNTCYFDRDPSDSDIDGWSLNMNDTFGEMIDVPVIGNYLCIEIINESSASTLSGLSVFLVGRK